jgi:hypothetical protein
MSAGVRPRAPDQDAGALMWNALTAKQADCIVGMPPSTAARD